MALLDTIRGAILPGTVDTLAARLGETPHATGTALGGIVAVILASMSRRVDAGDSAGVASMINGALAGGNPLDHQLAQVDALDTDTTVGLQSSKFSGLFGPNIGGIASALAGHFGIRPGSAQALLGIAGLFTAGGIGRLLGGNTTAPGIANLLRGEQSSINAAVPAGLAGIFGPETTTTRHAYEEPVAPPSAGLGKWWPLLLLALAAIVLIWALRSCSPDPVETPTVTEPSLPAVEPMPTPVVPTGSGVMSDTLEGRPVLRIFFDVGKSDVTKDLSTSASGIKTYFDAHPGSTVLVSGYNDPTGDAALNAELSKRRAEEVSKGLVAIGIPIASIRMIKPVNTSGTGDTNAESRRVDVTVAD